MTVTYGFYNSLAGDRKYNAQQMSRLFEGIINDGVFASIGDSLMVTAGGGMTVNVGTGRAWFNNTWTDNDATLPLMIDPSDLILNRIDAIVIEVGSSSDVRQNSIKIIKGTPASVPANPVLIQTEGQYQYPLCYINISAGVNEVTQGNIQNKIDTVDCPFVTVVGLDALLPEWQDQFDDWFADLQTQMEGNVAANLQTQVDARLPLAGGIMTGDIILKGAPTIDLHPATKAYADIQATKQIATQSVVDILIRDMLKTKMRQTGLNLDPNAWSDSLDDASGVNANDTKGILFDPLSKSIKKVTDSAQLATGGVIISGGDDGIYIKENAFDSNNSTVWQSYQTGNGCINSAYIGYVLPRPMRVNRLGLLCYSNGAWKIQYSLDGITWVNMTGNITIPWSGEFPVYGFVDFVNENVYARYWRIIATTSPGSINHMGVYTFELYEVGSVTSQAVWLAQTSIGTLSKVIVESIQSVNSGTITYYISRDGGITFTACALDTLINISAQPAGTSIVLKVVITGDAELLTVAWGGEV